MQLEKDFPLVSIVIPVYNGENFLSDAIQSALNQNYPNIEIIVVNDGSTDDGKTEQVALSFGDQIRYFSKPNGGAASALNFGIEAMKGEYFSWLSHDDLYSPDKVSENIKAMMKVPGNSIIYSDFSVINEQSRVVAKKHIKHVNQDSFLKNLICFSNINGCTLLIPRCALIKARGFNEDLKTTQDYDLWYRLSKEYNFFHIGKCLVQLRRHRRQDSQTKRDQCISEQEVLVGSMVEDFLLHSEKLLSQAIESYLMLSYRGFDFATKKVISVLTIKLKEMSFWKRVFSILYLCILIPRFLLTYTFKYIYQKLNKKLKFSFT